MPASDKKFESFLEYKNAHKRTNLADSIIGSTHITDTKVIDNLLSSEQKQNKPILPGHTAAFLTNLTLEIDTLKGAIDLEGETPEAIALLHALCESLSEYQEAYGKTSDAKKTLKDAGIKLKKQALATELETVRNLISTNCYDSLFQTYLSEKKSQDWIDNNQESFEMLIFCYQFLSEKKQASLAQEQKAEDKNPQTDKDIYQQKIEDLLKEDETNWWSIFSQYNLLSINKWRDRVLFINLLRLYWVFDRLTMKSSLLLGEMLSILTKLGNILGITISANNIIYIMEFPNPLLNVLSVTLFPLRSLLHAAMIKHVLFPLDGNTRWETLWQELDMRHANFINDIMWMVVNFLCNFSQYSGLSVSATLWLTAIFLVVDFSMFMYSYARDWRLFAKKQRQLKAELEQLNLTDAERKLLDAQLESLKNLWVGKQSMWYCYMLGAGLLAAGFTASFLLTSPFTLPLSFAVCLVGVTCYFTAGSYGNMMQKHHAFSANKKDKFYDAKLADYQLARNQFYLSFAKHLIMPTLIIGSVLVCWQLSIPIILACIAVHYGSEKYFESQKKRVGTLFSNAKTSSKNIDDLPESTLPVPV